MVIYRGRELFRSLLVILFSYSKSFSLLFLDVGRDWLSEQRYFFVFIM